MRRSLAVLAVATLLAGAPTAARAGAAPESTPTGLAAVRTAGTA